MFETDRTGSPTLRRRLNCPVFELRDKKPEAMNRVSDSLVSWPTLDGEQGAELYRDGLQGWVPISLPCDRREQFIGGGIGDFSFWIV